MSYAPFDVVVVPFPYSDRLAEKRRPALVVSGHALGADLDRLWVVMITSDRGQRLLGDAELRDLEAAGLPSASIVRSSKIATIETSRVLKVVGKLGVKDRDAATAALRLCAGF